MADAPWIRTNREAIVLLGRKQITRTDLAVLNAIASHADSRRRDCWPSIETLAAESAVHKRTVIRSISRLQQVGLLRVESRFSKNGQTKSNRYLLTDSLLDSSQTTSREGGIACAEGGIACAEGGTGATQTRSIELDPTGTRTVDLKDLSSKKEPFENLGDVSDADLKIPARLLELHARAVRLGWALDSKRHQQEFLAAAIYARRSGREPTALFCSLIRDGLFLEKLPRAGSEDDFDEACRQWRQWRRSQVEPTNPARELLVGKFDLRAQAAEVRG